MMDATIKSPTNAETKNLSWQSCFDVLRLGLSAVYSQGAGYRRKLLLKAMNPIAAPPLEIGIDPRPLVYLASEVEKQEAGYRKTCAVLLAVAVLAFFLEMPAFFFVLLVLAAAVVSGMHRARMQTALDNYSKGKFSLNIASKLLDASHDKKLDYGIGSEVQRVLVHKDFDPFKFAGVSIGKWSFTVDVERAAQTASGTSQITPVSTSEIESEMKRQLPQSGFGDLVVREILAIRGEDASVLPMISRDTGIKQPDVNLNQNTIAEVGSKNPNLVRRYLLFHDIRWDGGLILTHVVRTNLQGRIFYIETSRFVLTPPSQTFKVVDSTNFYEKTVKTKVGSFIAGAVASPFTIVAETYNLFAFATLGHSINRIKKEYLKSLETSPIYNYGSDESTRREMMDEKFDHFSQKADLDFAVKAFDQTIAELIYRYMEDHGVDVSDLRNKVLAIYNSGIIVQGGDVTAQAMAVGQGAAAQTNAPPKNPLNTQRKAS
jgi:hypothetical protein